MRGAVDTRSSCMGLRPPSCFLLVLYISRWSIPARWGYESRLECGSGKVEMVESLFMTSPHDGNSGLGAQQVSSCTQSLERHHSWRQRTYHGRPLTSPAPSRHFSMITTSDRHGNLAPNHALESCCFFGRKKAFLVFILRLLCVQG